MAKLLYWKFGAAVISKTECLFNLFETNTTWIIDKKYLKNFLALY